jgi:NAD(P)H-flavin reductase
MIITYKATILKRQQITPNVFLLSLSWPTDTNWNFVAGQYLIFHIPKMENGHPARRLYSIASAPLQRNVLDFVIEQVPNGIGSTYLHNTEIGGEVTVQGPAGLFVYKTSGKNPIFFATGTGIAPIYSMIYELLATGFTNDIYLYWGLKTKEDLYLMRELQELSMKFKNLHFTICLSREESVSEEHFFKGHVDTAYEAMLSLTGKTPTDFAYYLCGGKNVVTSLKGYLAEKQIPTEDVYFENFTV